MKYEREPESSSATLQVVIFSLGNERYGVETSQVKEIIRVEEITSIPNAPDFIEGVINLRGQITTIINLRKRFGMKPKPIDNDTRIIVFEHNGSTIGMMVDTVTEVRYLSKEHIDELPSIVTAGARSKFLRGVGKLPDGLLILVDLNRLQEEEYELLSS
ncbi:chemotaxis protein CheW [Archaeoglobus neptunius]|uniref:chemotaxis protein CheW n=1 Tax=Archaeoglobus neptunius TaxID=2798580 RepID=UPI0019267054